jgi:predicted RNA-binding Zn-ribbon protein involved in translation (DUF1610 family)
VPAPSRSLTAAGPRSSPPGTARSRAAAARSHRRSAASPGTAVKDPCPGCGTELGQAHGATRRVALYTAERGLFLWRCPDCRHGWAEVASSQCGSTTRSPEGSTTYSPERSATPAPRPSD